MAKQKYTFDINQILDLYNSGLTMEVVADKLNLPKWKILEQLHQANIHRKMGYNFSEKIKNEICESYESGLSLRKIADKFDTSFPYVRNLLISRNIDRRHRKYTLEERYFQFINTSDKSYILGLICADGNIRESGYAMKITLKDEDKYILDRVNEKIGSNRPIYLRVSEKGVYHSLSITSKLFCQDLISHGVIPRKTFTLKVPEIKQELLGHFLRGLFDGDGYLHIRKNRKAGFSCGIVLNLSFCQELQKILEKEGIETKIYQNSKRHKEIAEIRFGKWENLMKLFNLMYSFDNNFCLSRKYETFLELIARKNLPNKPRHIRSKK